MGLFTSTGLKRRIVAWLNTVLSILYAIPVLPASLRGAVEIITQVIQAFGGVAVTHAAVGGTLSKDLLLTAVSFLGVLMLLAHLIPGLEPLLPLLERLVPILSALAAGKTLTKEGRILLKA